MALAVGLYEVVKEPYLADRIRQVRDFARRLANNGVPVVLPAGGHAVYINVEKFFEGELLRHYGIRACELGPFAFEWDRKTPEQRKSILNLVRFAVPRNTYGLSHFNYAVAAVTELYRNREKIPKIRVSRGADLKLRHFQSGLQPIYKD